MKKLVFFVAVLSLVRAEVDSIENTFNCYTDYLKRHGVLEAKFVSEPFNGESVLCEAVLSTTVAGVYSALHDEFKMSPQLSGSADCIVDQLKQFKWSDLDIKEQVYVFSETMTDAEKDQKIHELQQQQANISQTAVISCMAEKEFGELFEQIFSKEEEYEDLAADYCARSYAIENKIIDTAVYFVDPNPNNINIKDVQCRPIVEKNFKEAEDELRVHLLKDIGENAHRVDCLIKKYHENHYFDKTLAVELLGELKITDDQKKVEKEKFIASMTKITMSLAECQWERYVEA